MKMRTGPTHLFLLAFGLFFSIVFLLGSARPVVAKVTLKVGVLSEPRGFNPFQATDSWTAKVLNLIYQPLYRIDHETLTLIPWLAAGQPYFSADHKEVTIQLRPMKWDNGLEFTAEDVVFTADLIKRFRIARYYPHWEFVQEVKAVDERTVKMKLTRHMATFNFRTLTTWIVQKKEWASIYQDALKRLPATVAPEKSDPDAADSLQVSALEAAAKIIQDHAVEKPVGLGPFRFVSRKPGSYVLLERNEHFFGQGQVVAGRELGPHLDRVILKKFDTLAAATLALNSGDIDFLWKGISHALLEDLTQEPHVRLIMVPESGYRYLGFNLRRSPMSDLVYRQAVAYLIDKDFIVKHILHDHGQRLNTFVSPDNRFYFNEHTKSYGEGLDRTQRTHAAHEILSKAGYKWTRPPLDVNGSLQQGEGLLMPGGRPLPPLTLLTPDPQYDTEAAASGKIITEWLRAFGIPVLWNPLPFTSLMNRIRADRDFDMFIMGWRNLSIDPDYLRRFFHSANDQPSRWNDSGYRDTEFDRLSDLQAATLSPQARRTIVFELQDRLSTHLPYVPLFVPHLMEAIRTDRFVGWSLTPAGAGNIWSFCQLRPAGS